MPRYRLSLEFEAADDRQAARLGMAWAGFGSVEYGTRNPIVVPVDGELRDRLGKAMMNAFDETAIVCDHTQVVQFSPLADAALAVVTPKLEMLRGELAEAQEAAAEWQAACEAHQADGERLADHVHALEADQ